MFDSACLILLPSVPPWNFSIWISRVRYPTVENWAGSDSVKWDACLHTPPLLVTISVRQKAILSSSHYDSWFLSWKPSESFIMYEYGLRDGQKSECCILAEYEISMIVAKHDECQWRHWVSLLHLRSVNCEYGSSKEHCCSCRTHKMSQEACMLVQ